MIVLFIREVVNKIVCVCRQKAGIMPDEPVKLYHFEVKRYK